LVYKVAEAVGAGCCWLRALIVALVRAEIHPAAFSVTAYVAATLINIPVVFV
jgi:hypothetical protein